MDDAYTDKICDIIGRNVWLLNKRKDRKNWRNKDNQEENNLIARNLRNDHDITEKNIQINLNQTNAIISKITTQRNINRKNKSWVIEKGNSGKLPRQVELINWEPEE